MKKILLVVLFVIAILASYVVYKELIFSPLEEKDFKKIFKDYKGNFNKSCSEDFLDASSNGELFEIYLYKIKGGVINKSLLEITEWEDKEVTNEVKVGKWRNCPLDNQTNELFKFTLTTNNFDNLKCFNYFNKELLNQKNYYSFIYFSELEQYFLLYCTESQELYYIRRKGF
jgi:hypothetical protein